MSAASFAESFVAWAQSEPSIAALVLIGSRCHERASVAAADQLSDWDYQIVTSRPGMFSSRTWLRAAGLPEPLAYVARIGRLARVGKVTAIFPDADLDLVLLPAGKLRLARWGLALGFGTRLARSAALGELALVVRPGHRVLKGGAGWVDFFRWVATTVPPPRLGDTEIATLAEGFVCDYVSARQKIERGELLAAQRWLHVQLAEANFRLAHELRLRRGLASFPDARRIETLGDSAVANALAINAAPVRESLARAVEHSAQTCRETVTALIGTTWRWPEGLASRLSRE